LGLGGALAAAEEVERFHGRCMGFFMCIEHQGGNDPGPVVRELLMLQVPPDKRVKFGRVEVPELVIREPEIIAPDRPEV